MLSLLVVVLVPGLAICEEPERGLNQPTLKLWRTGPPVGRCLPWVSGETGHNVSVDTSCQLCSGEQMYVQARAPMVEQALQKFLGREIDATTKKFPKLAFCCSGGSYHAMISSLGFLSGMMHIGLKDAVTYNATLSGSAWGYAHWLLRKHQQGLDLLQFREILQKRVTEPLLDVGCYDFGSIVDKLVSVLTGRGKIKVGDFLGGILANRLWGDLPQFQDITFEPLRQAYRNAAFNEPFPLFALVIGDVQPYEWLEVNPFVTGSDYLRAYVPTESFDSFFENGLCVEKFDERSLGWFLGEIASVYNCTPADILIFIAKAADTEWLSGLVERLIEKFNLYENRMFSFPVYNFVWKMDGFELEDRQEFDIADAGMDFNLPFPLLFKQGREVDIIFVCQAFPASDISASFDLRYAKEYAERKGLKFPPIDNPKKITEHVAIFEDENDKSVPIVVYYGNPIKGMRLEFAYSFEEFYEVHDAMKYQVLETRDAIQEVLLQWIG